MTAPAPQPPAHGAEPLPPFEVFRAGTHTAMDGQRLSFSRGDLEAIAAAYDPAAREAPLVAGHPKHDDPAYGWLDRLEVKGDTLVAHPKQVDSAFAEMVRKGRFKHRSIALLPPGSPGNPSATAHYPKHIGFLGAQPPAVQGLKPIAFGRIDETSVAFMEPWQQSGLGRMLQRLREWLIAEKGAETADRVLPSWEIEDVSRPPATPAPQPFPAFSEPPLNPPPREPEVSETKLAELQAQLDAEKTAREAAERRVAEQAAAFAEAAARDRRRDDEAFLDGLVTEGRFLPALKADALAFMATLEPKEAVVAFAEGEKRAPHAAFRELLGKLPKVIPFGEFAGGMGEIRAVDPQDASSIQREAAAFIEREAKQGRAVTIAEAIEAVTKGAAA
jgi:hypothetical protein